MFPIIAKIAEIGEEVAASVEEMHISELAMQDMKEGLAQIREAESSTSTLSSAEGMNPLEPNSKYIKDGQLYSTDSSGIASVFEKEAKKDAVSSQVEQASLETAKNVADIKNQLKESVDQYKKELVENSPFPETLNLDELDFENIEKVPKEKLREMRDEFKNNKEALISEWERRTGKEWPRYKEDVIKNGVVIRRKGDLYDAHHIKPLSWGGENKASNITPLEWGPHHLKVHGKESGFTKTLNLLNNMAK